MERPTNKSGYTAQDLRVYAQWRKEQEFKDIQKVLADEEADMIADYYNVYLGDD